MKKLKSLNSFEKEKMNNYEMKNIKASGIGDWFDTLINGTVYNSTSTCVENCTDTEVVATNDGEVVGTAIYNSYQDC